MSGCSFGSPFFREPVQVLDEAAKRKPAALLEVARELHEAKHIGENLIARLPERETRLSARFI